MKFSHKIKLIPARVRWFFTRIRVHFRVTQTVLRHASVLDFKKALHEEYIAAHRKSPTSNDTAFLRGKLEVLDELLHI